MKNNKIYKLKLSIFLIIKNWQKTYFGKGNCLASADGKPFKTFSIPNKDGWISFQKKVWGMTMSDRPNTCPDIFFAKGTIVRRAKFLWRRQIPLRQGGKVSVTATE